jgi:hypothetical protein
MRNFMNRSVLFPLGMICFACVALTTLAQAETLLESSLFYRIYLAFSVDQEAAQEWLPAPWKVVPVPKGPFKGANLYVIFDDKFIMQDAAGKPYMGGGTYCLSALVAFAKNQQSGEVLPFVTRIYWFFDDPSSYKNAVKATVSREASIKGATPESGAGTEVWKVEDSAGGMIEFRMDYQRALPTRKMHEFKVSSSVDTNILFTYKDDAATDVVKSIPDGIDRVKNYKFRVTMTELRKMFDGSEKLVGILVNPSRVRLKYGP